MRALPPIVEADLHSFVDNQLPAERRVALAHYLAQHPQEAARVENWRHQNEMIQAAFGPIAEETVPVSLSLGRSVAARFSVTAGLAPPALTLVPEQHAPANAATQERGGTRQRRISGMAAFVFGLSAAFGLAGLALLGLDGRIALPGWNAATDPAQAFAEQALDAHTAYAGDNGLAFDMAAGKAGALQVWLSQRTGVAIALPDLSAEGFVLAGGRITPSRHGPAAWLLYHGSDGDRLSLMVSARAFGAASALHAFDRTGLRTVAGSTGKASFALTGTAAHVKLLQMARIIGSAGMFDK